MTEPPRKADHFYLHVSFSSGQFHIWDLAGYVASTSSASELQDWLEYQNRVGKTEVGYGALRERFFPGSYERKLQELLQQGRPAGELPRRAPKPKLKFASTQTAQITGSGKDLLLRLGLGKKEP